MVKISRVIVGIGGAMVLGLTVAKLIGAWPFKKEEGPPHPMEYSGTVRVLTPTSNPFQPYAPVVGAAVSVDGIYVGDTDSVGNVQVSVMSGSHTFSASKAGYTINPVVQDITSDGFEIWIEGKS